MTDKNSAPERDTIVALSTAWGKGAIAIVRLSGPESERILRRIFKPRKKKAPLPERRYLLGRFVDEAGGAFDEGVAVFMAGPNSFTGEDMAEMHCHGGPAVVQALIGAARDAGARPAAPGEFTRRAFLSGKIDLVQSESVADLVAAETSRAARAALTQLEGGLSAILDEIWEEIVEAGAHLEAAIDFPDEFEPGAGPAPEGGPMSASALRERFMAVAARLRELEASYQSGRVLREGARVAILGKPNAGKSTLLNRLLGTGRAITSPLPGTTRDTVEEVCDIGGIPVRLIDTAGLRETEDAIEKEGAERARRAAAGADLCLILIDAAGGAPEAKWGREEQEKLEPPSLLLANKIDLPGAQAPEEDARGAPPIAISALEGDGLDDLRAAIARVLSGAEGEAGPGGQAILTRERHRDLVARCRKGVEGAADAIATDLSPELVAVHLNEAQGALSELLGRSYGEALLDKIFSEFCIGK